jgi:acylphosphatase
MVMMMIRATVRVTGEVQGVNFRSSTKAEADALGLCGSVRNCPDGSVEVVSEGPRTTVQQLVDWCRTGPIWARVDDVTVEWQAASGEFSEFKVRR